MGPSGDGKGASKCGEGLYKFGIVIIRFYYKSAEINKKSPFYFYN